MSVKKITVSLLLVLLALCSVLLVNTAKFSGTALPIAAHQPLGLDEVALAERLAQGLRLRTISVTGQDAMEEFATLLRTLYPRVHEALRLERVNGHSLLYTWAGADPALKPALFAAHMDVVPIEPGTEADWTQPPFAGAIADGYIWGRGALDNKSGLMGLMEACERLLADGYAPDRTLYLAFGHDEEVGGGDGAAQIAALLRQRGVELAFSLDEGSALLRGIIAGVKPPVAAIMAAEKGYVSFRLSTKGEGGHSSMPNFDPVLPRLARAVSRLDAQPLPPRMTPLVANMLESLAPEMPFVARLMIANRWLFEPLLLHTLAQKPITNAMIRTTQAVTVLHGGVKDNVLPSEAYALVNFRLLPGDSVATVQAHLSQVIDDAAIELSVEDGFISEPPPASDPSAPAFELLANSIRQVFPKALVSTGLVMATTDNRHYATLSEQSYYIAPFSYTPADRSRIHGSDERIALSDYANMVRFYVQGLRAAGQERWP